MPGMRPSSGILRVAAGELLTESTKQGAVAPCFLETVRVTFRTGEEDGIFLPIAEHGCGAAISARMDANSERIGRKIASFERKVLNSYKICSYALSRLSLFRFLIS